MIRVFNHYLNRQTVVHVLLDGLLFVVVVLILLALQLQHVHNMAPMAGAQMLPLTAGITAGMMVIGSASGMYQRAGNLTFVQSLARGMMMLLVALPSLCYLISLLPTDTIYRDSLQWAVIAGLPLVVLRRIYLLTWGDKAGRRTRALIFGAGPAAEIVAQTLKQSDPGIEIVGFYPGPNERASAVPSHRLLSGSRTLIDTACDLDVDEIVVALTERRAGSMPLRQLLDCKLLGVKVYDLATHFEKRLGQIRIDFVNAGWLIFGDGFNQDPWRATIKRFSDIFFSLVLIVVSAPIMLATALLIKLESRGPVFYRQERVGQNGTTFMVTKFRSMRTDAEQDGKPRWASASDDRVTRVGRIIRRVRIDELPQLFNVLKGDMSLVGPRPERPFFVDQLTEQIPYFAARHSVKPGVTGWAQVRYAYGATVEDAQNKLQYDLYYVKNHSLFLDLLVLFETVGVVLTGKGAR
jgi:sugar transferase (PEP-CTERM system associated)